MTTSCFDQSSFDEWLKDQPDELKPLICGVRDAIVAAGYNFQEATKWGSPCYWLPEISRRNIVWFQHHNDYIRLGFFNGVTMPDPDGLLEGTGKRLRHIKIYEISAADRKILTKYVRASAAHAVAEPNSLSG